MSAEYTNPYIHQFHPEGSPLITQIDRKNYSADEYDIFVVVSEKSDADKAAIAEAREAKRQGYRARADRADAWRENYIADYEKHHGHKPSGYVPVMTLDGQITGL
jgi:hypothetical protein